MNFAVSVVVLLGATAIVGIALAIWAWRGKRVDDHPLCRRCGFDLTGKPEDSTRCAECGADLSRPRAIRVGHRRRRTAALGVALLLLLATLSLGGLGAWATVHDMDLSPYKPMSWLASDLLSPMTGQRVVALREFQRRMSLPSPDRAALLTVADRVLAAQADPAKPWGPEEGDFIDGLRAAKLLDDARYARYAANGLDVVVTARPKIRIGDRLPVRIAAAGRVGSRATLYVEYRPRLELDGKTLLEGKGSISSWVQTGGGSMTTSVSGSDAEASRLTPGTLDATVVIDMTVTETPARYTSPPADAPVIARKALRRRHVLEVLPRGTTDDVRPIRTPGLDDKVKAAIARPNFQVPSTPGYFNGMIEYKAVPEDVAFEALAIYKGREFPFGTMTVHKGGSTFYGFGGTAYIAYDIPDEVDLVLRPSPDAARDTVDQFSYADVEVRFARVAIPKPATQPTTR